MVVGFQLPSGSIVAFVRLIHEEKNGLVNWRGGWASSQFFAAMTSASTSFVGLSFLSSAMKESSTSFTFRGFGAEGDSATFIVNNSSFSILLFDGAIAKSDDGSFNGSF